MGAKSLYKSMMAQLTVTCNVNSIPIPCEVDKRSFAWALQGCAVCNCSERADFGIYKTRQITQIIKNKLVNQKMDTSFTSTSKP